MSDDDLTIVGRRVERLLLSRTFTRRCDLADCMARCCTHGALLDVSQKRAILERSEQVAAHLPADRADPRTWFDGGEHADPDFPSGRAAGTAVVSDPSHPAGRTCVFLRPADRWCALQVAAVATGDPPWSLKPHYCALFPITVLDGRVSLDTGNSVYAEGGDCQRDAGGPSSAVRTFEPELRLALGDEGYLELLSLVRCV